MLIYISNNKNKIKTLNSTYQNNHKIYKENPKEAHLLIEPVKTGDNRYAIFNKLAIYKQKNTKNWFVRIYKSKDCQKSISCKTDILKDAIKFAILEYNKSVDDSKYYFDTVQLSADLKKEALNNQIEINEKIYKTGKDFDKIVAIKKGKTFHQVLRNLDIYTQNKNVSSNWYLRTRIYGLNGKRKEKRYSTGKKDIRSAMLFALSEYKNLSKLNEMRNGCVYICENEIINQYYKKETYKIGKTNMPPHKRESSLSTSLPIPYTFKAIILTNNPIKLEKILHSEFTKSHLAKEFYSIHYEEIFSNLKEKFNVKMFDLNIFKDFYPNDFEQIKEYFKNKNTPDLFVVNF